MELPAQVMAIHKKGSPSNDNDLRQRVARMRGLLSDSAARFSGTDAFQELRLLRAYAGHRQDLLPERREILSMLGTVVSRSQLLDYDDGLEPMRELMTLEDGDDRPLKQRMLDHYAFGTLAAGQATIPGHDASHAVAAEQFGKAAALADQLPEYTENQRAGMRESQAYELHEAGKYDEALALNQSILLTGEKLFGKSDARLMTVLTNIAQNLHALNRRAECEPYLLRVQAIAESDGDLDKVQDMLFQRGVLAYELGHMDEARQLMKERIARLETAADKSKLEDAREDYAELERRLASK